MKLTRSQILAWLQETRPAALEELWRQADEVRRDHVGDQVHLRGLVELSNICHRHCLYCGLRMPNTGLLRYRMSAQEIAETAHTCHALGYGTVVLQSGEDQALDISWLVGVIHRIKQTVPLAITLSVGERSRGELALLREAGADRYLLRFETSNQQLFHRIHPPSRELPERSRMDILAELRSLGYEVGSGIMIGVPGQTWDDLVNDVLTFAELDLDMIGVGPYIPHPHTPLGRHAEALAAPPAVQVPGDELTTYKTVALARLICPDANIPATTALATLNPAQGRELALQRGANVIMPNITPQHYRSSYEIYPNKVCVGDTAHACLSCVTTRVLAIGRTIGHGPGTSPNRRRRCSA
jgi:biotin synthase